MTTSEADLLDLLEDLDDQLKALSDCAQPLITANVQDTATKLTVSDKARLYVLVTYAIESLLFAYLRLNGTELKDHSIRNELSRVRNYVMKIKDAQAAPSKNMELNKEAAGRFIKAALSGNDKYDADRAATQAQQRENAQKKLDELTAKIEAEKAKMASKVAEMEAAGGSGNASAASSSTGSHVKKSKKRKSDVAVPETIAVAGKKKKVEDSVEDEEKKKRKAEKKAKKEGKGEEKTKKKSKA